MSHHIEPLAAAHFDRLHDLFDAVCREERFMAFTQAGPREQTRAYYRGILDGGHTHVVALEGDALIGWCDVLPLHGQMRAHAGVLGMAVAAPARGLGVGTALIQAALQRATARGLTRIELTVHADNTVAQTLYRRHGFVHEGTQRRGWCLRGQYADVHHMARLA
jgi:putative acetyltransferase